MKEDLVRAGTTVRMIVADLDDTLVRTDKSISEYTRRTFKACKERGMLTAFATARLAVSTGSEYELLEPDVRIVSGGAMVIHKEQVILYQGMGETVTDRFLEQLVLAEATGIYVGCRDQVYTNSDNYRDTRTLKDSVYHRFKEPLGEDACQIFFRLKHMQDEVKLREMFPTLNWIYYRAGGYAVVTKGVSKETALLKAAQLYGIPTEQIAAFGDDEGDIEMLRMCGMGVAMGNALPSVKQAAAFVTDSNEEDGVARFLEKYVLKHRGNN